MTVSIYGNSQKNNDIIYLNNGTIYQGTISELIPDSIISILLSDGKLKTINFSEISSYKSDLKKKSFNNTKKYYLKGSLGILMGQGAYQNQLENSMQFETMAGYKYKNWSVGLGSGINVLYKTIFIPAIGEINYSFNAKNRTSPFLSIQSGLIYNLSYQEDDDLSYYRYYNQYKKGGFVGGTVGLRHSVSDNLGLVFEAGYRYYELKGQGQETVYNQIDLIYYPYNVDYKSNLHRFNLKIGLVF